MQETDERDTFLSLIAVEGIVIFVIVGILILLDAPIMGMIVVGLLFWGFLAILPLIGYLTYPDWK